MRQWDLTNKIAEFFQQHPEQKFTAREIAEWVLETYPDECRQKRKRSKAQKRPIDDEVALKNQIINEISGPRWKRLQSNKKFEIAKGVSPFKTTEGRPRKYYFSELTDSQEVDTVDDIKEEHLYLMLSTFLKSEFGIDSKRIDEKKSGNSQGAGANEWLHPDLVGLEDLGKDWGDGIADCVKQYGDKRAKLWSFEVKRRINRANVRSAFFQTVSNSSWANYSYLVAGEIGGADAMKELRMLAGLHGIGFIRLDIENPAESQILIPAKERSQVDWDTANRLAKENSDFAQYIKLIRKFCLIGTEAGEGWSA